MKIVKNFLSDIEIKTLLDYYSQPDHRTDARPDITSKHPEWNIDDWPQSIVQRVLDQMLDYEYKVEEVIFLDSKKPLRLHVDSGNSDRARRGYNVLMPLFVDGPSHTVFFENFWQNDGTTFSKRKILPFEYDLMNKNGEWQYVPDVKQLLEHIKNKGSHPDFIVNQKFVDDLKNVIKARSNQSIAKMSNRVSNYSQIVNFDKNKKIEKRIHETYLNHLDYDTIDGLTINKIVRWVPGTVITFERTRLHSASSSPFRKIGLTIFTEPVN